MVDRPLASDLSYEIFQLRRLRGELTAPALDSQNRRLYAIPCAIVQREAFISSRPTGVSEAEWHIERQRRRLQG